MWGRCVQCRKTVSPSGKDGETKKLITATLIYISVITEFNPFLAAIREKAKMNTIIKVIPPLY